MRKIITLLILTPLFFCACKAVSPLTVKQPTWEDNFNETSFNQKYWTKIPRGTADWDRHMSNDPALYDMRDGKLILKGTVNNDRTSDTARFITGGLYTKDKIFFGLGRWEIRAKLNGTTGAWPAFWLLPQGEAWPGGGEIDIMERLNFDSIAYQTVHSHYTHVLGQKTNPKQGGTGTINPNGFNTYAVELYADSLVFFINNKKTFTYPRIETDKPGQFPFNKNKYYLLIDMQLGGSWVGAVKPEELPVEMEIDWVRFYGFDKK